MDAKHALLEQTVVGAAVGDAVVVSVGADVVDGVGALVVGDCVGEDVVGLVVGDTVVDGVGALDAVGADVGAPVGSFAMHVQSLLSKVKPAVCVMSPV